MENLFETLGAILSPATKRCGCVNVEIGSYDNQVMIADLPSHMAKYKAKDGGDPNSICVDACLEKEIRILWSLEITTTGCCCGHNKTEPYIGVIFSDIPKMKALGYKVKYNNCRPNDEDSFTPQSLK